MAGRRSLASILAAVLLLPLLATVEVAGAPAARAAGVGATVRDLVALPGPDTIELSWRRPDHADAGTITAYRFDVRVADTSVADYPLTIDVGALRGGDDRPDEEEAGDGLADPLLYGVVLASLTTGMTYDVGVAAVVGGVVWEQATETVTPRSAPSAPQALELAPFEDRIVASWTAPTTDGGLALTGYRVEVFPPTVGPLSVDPGQTSVTIAGLQQETRYTVSVVARNDFDVSIPDDSSDEVYGASPPAVGSVRTLSPVGAARLGGVAATTTGTVTTLRAPVIDNGRPTSVDRVGFVYAATDPPLLDAVGSTFVAAVVQDRVMSATVTLPEEQLNFVRAVVEATYDGPLSISYGPSVPYTVTDRTISFTNLGASGRLGPLQAAADGFYSTGQGGSVEHRVEIRPSEQGIQRYLVEHPGAYRIEAAGAAAGGGGGRGAVVSGTFRFDRDDPLMIAVGQLPTGRGGGGGTFVTSGAVLADAEPLLVAGGGGGQGLGTLQLRAHGRVPVAGELEVAGQDGGSLWCAAASVRCNSAAGQTGGSGGRVQLGSPWANLWSTTISGAGGGFRGNGVDGYWTRRDYSWNSDFPGSAGRSFVTGATGGAGRSGSDSGGFGGGGANVSANRPAGGGGGYNGGGGGVMDAVIYYSAPGTRDLATHGGGGGSYNAGDAPEGVTGGNAPGAAGYVEMRLLAHPPSAAPTQVEGVRAGARATLTSRVVSTGGDQAVERGFLLSREPDATLGSDDAIQIVAAGQGDGDFTATSPTLEPRTFLYVRSYVAGYGGVSYGPLATLATFRPFTFTTAGRTGPTGPTSAQLADAYVGTPLQGAVQTDGVPQGIQRFTVPVTGRYRIQALGARGGVNTPPGFRAPQGGDLGGQGAAVEGTFDLEAGDQLLVLVGQQPDNPVGGGGGSFVALGSTLADEDLAPLLVAGGGGAVSFPFDVAAPLGDASVPGGVNLASTSNSDPGYGGTDGRGGLTAVEGDGGGGGDGGMAGLGTMGVGGPGGGSRTALAWSGAGGGLLTDGEDGQNITLASGTELTVAVGSGGRSFLAGGGGGIGVICTTEPTSTTVQPDGGFGGGGAGAGAFRPNCWAQGGNGGGYNGAGSTEPMAVDQYPRIGRGAGSYNAGLFPSNLAGANLGGGRVTVTLIPAAGPTTLAAPTGQQPRDLDVPDGTVVERQPGRVLVVVAGTATTEVVTTRPAADLAATRTFVDDLIGETGLDVLVDVVGDDEDVEVVGLLDRTGDPDDPVPVPSSAIAGVSTGDGDDGVRLLLAGADDQDRPRDVDADGAPTTTPGGRIATVGRGLPAGTQGEVSVRSEPRSLGGFTVDTGGRFAWQVRLPGDLAPGQHTLVIATDGASSTVVTVGIVVAPTATPAPAPAPRPPVADEPDGVDEGPQRSSDGALPAPAPGAGEATVGGEPIEVRLERPSSSSTTVVGDGFELVLDTAVSDPAGPPAGDEGGDEGGAGDGGSPATDPADDEDVGVVLPRGHSSRLTLRGFAPSTPVQLWLLSDPVRLGAFETDADGVLDAAAFDLPDDVSACPHTLHAVGRLPDGQTVAVSLGVWVDAPRAPYDDLVGSRWRRHATCLADREVTLGYEDGMYRPAAIVSRQAAVAWLYRSAGSPPVTVDEAPFTDVGLDHRFLDAITWAVREGITEGYEDGSFRPARPVSRAAFAAFLYRSSGAAADAPQQQVFTDVGPGHRFVTEIGWAVDHGLVRGRTDGSFQPGASIGRGPGAAMLVRAERAPTAAR